MVIFVVVGKESNDDRKYTPSPAKTEVEKAADNVTKALNNAEQDNAFAKTSGYKPVSRQVFGHCLLRDIQGSAVS